MPKISLIIHTASRDNFLAVQGIASYFDALTWTLKEQTFKEFELIYVDTYQGDNAARFGRIAAALPYRVKHVPIHPAHRYWYDKGYCFISAAKNTGILYADGDLCISCDDAEFFPETFLAEYWKQYKTEGRYLHALHKRLRSVELEQKVPRMPITGDLYVNDHRWKHVDVATGKPYGHRHGTMCYAGTSFSLADAFNLNGYNERMDGCKSLEDCDFGNRLKMIGRSFVLHPAGHLFILDHGSSIQGQADIKWDADQDKQGDCQETALPSTGDRRLVNFIAVENNGLLRCGGELQDIVANKNPLTDDHWKIIREETIKHQHFDPLAPERAAALALWKGTPTFNLLQQWEELRRSPDWKWK